ncbi:MAG TPA: DNA repair protein RecO [Usitatibacteraceae bacterium]
MRLVGDSSAGFVLHSYPYRETSLIVESFTRSHGRMVFVAKGAKRPASAMKGALNPFQRLLFNWFGKAEMKTLKSVEHGRIFPQLNGSALMSAFYMNELLLKLAHREDAHEALFDAYEAAVMQLSGAEAPLEIRGIGTVLRRFEIALLRELGYALMLVEEADTHQPIIAAGQYLYLLERGPVALGRIARQATGDGLQLNGKTLLDMQAGDFTDPVTQQQSKQLMRRAINHMLGDKPLHTRQLIRELQGS